MNRRKITVAVPTHNRASMLLATLESVAAAAPAPGYALECLVVDNGSTDDTATAVQRFAKRAPMVVRYVFEPRPGSSFARNRAALEAQGDPIFFIDDDVTVAPNWAVELARALEERRLDGACGLVVPRWLVARPPWLGPLLYPKLAVHDESAIAGAPAGRTDKLDNYFSANVGLRRGVFARFGFFREDLGVVAGNPMSGEDTEFFERIIARGGAFGFAPLARVVHAIPAERMTIRYLRHKAFAFGMGSAMRGGRTHNRLDKLVRNAARMTLATARGNREAEIYHQLECANFFGYWWGRLLRLKAATAAGRSGAGAPTAGPRPA